MNISHELGRARGLDRRLHPRPRHGQHRRGDAGTGEEEHQTAGGHFLTWGGEFENQQRAMKRLAVIVPVSVLLIFVLLFEAFGSRAAARC